MAADSSLEKRQDLPTSTSTTTTTSSTTTSTTSTTTTSTSTSSSTSTSTSSQSTPSSTSTPTSVPTSVSSPSSATTPPSISDTVTRSTGANGGVTTITRTVAAGIPSQTPSTGGGGFWNNKTAVGATFGVAGVIGLVVIFLLITTCLRRRRARKFDRAVSEAAAEAAATNADPFIGEDDAGYRGAGWDPRRRASAGLGYGKLHDDPFGHGGPAAMAATGGAGGMYAKRQSINNGQYAQDAYGMNNIRGSGAQTSVYSGTTNYTSHPSYGGGAGYYANELPPVPLHQNAYGRPSFGSTNAPGIAGVGAAGGNYGQDTQIGYRNAPGNSIDGTEDAYGGYARSSVAEPYPNAYANQNAYPGPSSPRTSSSPPPASRSPPPAAAPPSYHGHGSQGNDHYFTRNEKSRPLSGGAGGGMNMPAPPSAAHFQPPDMTPGVGTPDESYNNGGRILRVANE